MDVIQHRVASMTAFHTSTMNGSGGADLSQVHRYDASRCLGGEPREMAIVGPRTVEPKQIQLRVEEVRTPLLTPY